MPDFLLRRLLLLLLAVFAVQAAAIASDKPDPDGVQVWHGGIELFNFNALMTRNSVDAGIC